MQLRIDHTNRRLQLGEVAEINSLDALDRPRVLLREVNGACKRLLIFGQLCPGYALVSFHAWSQTDSHKCLLRNELLLMLKMARFTREPVGMSFAL